ncbi:AAAD deacetylase, partial [Zosterops hypoxanthus]|nr:AAAD deacetylase [Zosterops hypoxanthus]
SEVAELLGWNYMEGMRLFMVISLVPPTSDENVTVTDTEFSNVPVRLFVPRRAPGGLRRAVIFFHGGGWCLGDAGIQTYDVLTRRISNELDAVVVSVNYRLAPPHHFPAQFEDVYAVTKWFLQRPVLAQHGVDPGRVCVAGDSAGGNLAAAVAQQVQQGCSALSIGALGVSPSLGTAQRAGLGDCHRALGTGTWLCLSHWGHRRGWRGIRALSPQNTPCPPLGAHSTPTLTHLGWFRCDVWGGNFNYRCNQQGKQANRKTLTNEPRLRRLPPALLLTCQHDVLRDDGLMYAARLRAAGVPVTLHHARDAFHGALTFLSWPFELALAHRLLATCLDWLRDNL